MWIPNNFQQSIHRCYYYYKYTLYWITQPWSYHVNKIWNVAVYCNRIQPIYIGTWHISVTSCRRLVGYNGWWRVYCNTKLRCQVYRFRSHALGDRPEQHRTGLYHSVPSIHSTIHSFLTDVHCPDTKQYIFLVRWLHFHLQPDTSALANARFSPFRTTECPTRDNQKQLVFLHIPIRILSFVGARPILFLFPSSNHSFCCLDCVKTEFRRDSTPHCLSIFSQRTNDGIYLADTP